MIYAEKLTFGFDSTLLFQKISFSLEENCHCTLSGSDPDPRGAPPPRRRHR